MKLYERSEFWALVGIIIGFVLSVAWEITRNKLSLSRKRKAIKNELRTNLGLIPQKIDHLNNLKASLTQRQLLPSASVHCTTYLYDLYIGDVGPRLRQNDRAGLNVIYESMKVVDRFLDNVFREFIDVNASGQLPVPFQAYIDMCDDLIDRCNLTQEMIGEYLEGNLRQVTW